MQFEKTSHPDMVLVKPKKFSDARGYFSETYQKQVFIDAGIPHEFVQDNHSFSLKNVLRGLHYQFIRPQGKLVRVAVGKVFDVGVDLRKSSPHYGQWAGEILSDENAHQLWIPPGFAHGYFVLSDQAHVLYKTTDFYFPQGDRCIRWDDHDLAIDWPVLGGEEPVLSEKDKNGQRFSEAEVYA